MNNIQVFQNAQFGQIRTAVTESGEPLFIAKDVCGLLGINKYRDAMSRLDADERVSVRVDTLGGNQDVTALTESGLYNLMIRSDKPDAKPFRKWVTSEVLPALRKTGGYMVAKVDESPEQLMARALMVAQDTLKRTEAEKQRLIEQNELSKQQLQIQAPKVQYYNEALDSSSYLTINKIALDMGMSAIRLNRILCEKRIQYRDGNSYLLYSKYRDNGYAVLRPHPYIDSLGRQQTRHHLYWTERGREFIYNLLSK